MNPFLKIPINKPVLLSIFLFSLFVIGCSPEEQKSLLSAGTACTDASCTQSSVTDITGDPSITVSDQVMNVEQSDLAEITGDCSDLGRKNNQIRVSVFSAEESVSPYIDNSISKNCQVNTIGLLTSYQCIFVTVGNGITDASSGATYPQCINGKYGFKVRLGSVSKILGVVQKYTVRLQLLTFPGQSPVERVKISRDISPPEFTLSPPDAQSQCAVRIKPFKFKTTGSATENIPIITYSIKRQDVGFDVNGAQNPAVIPAIPPDRLAGFFSFNASRIDAGDSIANFIDGGISAYSVLSPTAVAPLQPGVKYTYYVQAQAGADVSVLSSPKTCNMPTPTLYMFMEPSLGVCHYRLSPESRNPFVAYQWCNAASAAAATAAVCVPLGPVCSGSGDCNQSKVGSATNYIAVRTVMGGMYSKWSNVMACD